MVRWRRRDRTREGTDEPARHDPQPVADLGRGATPTPPPTLKSDDERVTGTQVAPWSTDRWGTQYDGVLVPWGTSRITNSGGGWVGRYTGVYTPKTHDTITWWFTGTRPPPS